MSEVSDRADLTGEPTGATAGDEPTGAARTTDRATGDGSNGEPSADPAAPSPNAIVLAGLAATDVDLERGRHLVDLRAGRRIRRRRVVLGGVGVIAAFGLAFLLWPKPDPEQINADGDRHATTTTAVTTSTAPPVSITTVPVTTVATTTTVKPTVTTVATTIATTTTIPPNQSMTVTAKLVDATGNVVSPTAGQSVVLRVNWSDPDLADPSVVEVHAEFGDPLVALPISSASHPGCDVRGGGSSAQVDLPFRFSTPSALGGSSGVSVEVTACDGAGAYGERQTVKVPVTVTAQTDRRVAVLAGLADGGAATDGAVLDATGQVLEDRVPNLGLVLASDGATRAVVSAVRSNYAGALWWRWSAQVACQRSAQPAEIAAQPETVKVILASPPAACPVQTGAISSTTP